MTKVSIIIPVYNVAPYLDQCLSSCVNQTFREIEIIVVNDASPDASRQIIEKYAAADDRIVVVHKEQNEGLIYARKSGIEIARSEYIFHLDGDDCIPDTAVEYLYREILCNPALDLVIGDYCVMKNNQFLRYKYYNQHVEITGQDFLYEVLSRFNWSVWGKLIRKTLYNSVVYEQVSIGEDFYQWIQLVPQVKTMSVVHSCVYHYNERSDSMSNNPYRKRRSTQYLRLVESVYSLMAGYPYKKRVKEWISVLLLNWLCSFCQDKETEKAQRIMKREFLQKREFRRFLWKEHKLFYLKYGLYLFFPKLCGKIIRKN